MDEKYRKITLKEFLAQYSSDDSIKENKGRKFCFILGSGASVQSGIPSGVELVKEWIENIEKIYEKENVEKWKLEIGLQTGNEAEKYSEIYEKRFEINRGEGYLFLEKKMENVEPSFGYSVLAQILDKTQHNLVITTNFDGLTEDAMFIYTKKRPLILGHESLAGYMNIFSQRPIIAKIHRDLLLSPKSRCEETNSLGEAWEKNLSVVLKYYTPLVIGYGGNDGSLMNFLEKQSNFSSGMFWFYWEKGGLPNEKILDLVGKYNGFIVPIEGFDEMMLQFNETLGYKLFDKELTNIAEERTKSYRQQVDKINSNKNTSDEIKSIILSAVKKQKEDWWITQIEIDNEEDIDKKNEMYKRGIEEINNSPELIGGYAWFLEKTKKAYDEAEIYYKKALEIDPVNIVNIGNYAVFLSKKRKQYDEAEKYYKKALELAPNNLANLTNYAVFFDDIRKYNEAEIYYKKVLEVAPFNALNMGNYALFLTRIKKEYNEAEKYYKKALELFPTNAVNFSNYAVFLEDTRKKYNEAEEYFKKALELDAKNADNIGNYAKLKIEKEEYDGAESFINQAFALDSRDSNTLLIELWFYRYAIYEKWYVEGEKEIERLLKNGIKSIGWNLDVVCEKAKIRGHKNLAKLYEFKEKITKE